MRRFETSPQGEFGNAQNGSGAAAGIGVAAGDEVAAVVKGVRHGRWIYSVYV